MKALTICQPYAHLILAGDKRVENRNWPTRYRGALAIHAGKSRNMLRLRENAFLPGQQIYDETYGIDLEDMTFGAVIGFGSLVDCLHIDDIEAGSHDHTYPWLREHEHAEGPWCWVLANVEPRAEPAYCRGSLGLWDWTPEVPA